MTEGTAELVEWDLPAAADLTPGAIAADEYGNSEGLWFVTRDGSIRVIHLQPPQRSTKSGTAQWASWELDPSGFTTGGVKRVKASHDRRYAFVRTVNPDTPITSSVQRIDTNNCATTTDPVSLQRVTACDRTTYQDNDAAMISDLVVDGSSNVYTAISLDLSSATNSFIEKLVPTPYLDASSPTSWSASTTRWNVGGGAGSCFGASSNPCLSGIAIHPKNSNLIYFSQPDSNSIGELNICNNVVRTWSLDAVSAQQPRQMNFDSDGILWVVTGSGHLVSLDPKKNTMTEHKVPLDVANDLFGVAPDGSFVGYTAADLDKVAMLIPRGKDVYVQPATTCIQPICAKVPVKRDTAPQASGSTQPQPKEVPATITSKDDGVFVEAQISSAGNDSSRPLGIIPHLGKGTGTFFYAVGNPVVSGGSLAIRVGMARLPRSQFKNKHEREDKDCDDDGSGHDDEDHDGIKNERKTSDSHGKMDRDDDQLAPGQSKDYNMTADSSTMALVTSIQADNPLVPVSIQILDPNGISLALPVATPGFALGTIIPTMPGNYTVRVKNEGTTPINHETQLITRQPLSLP